MANNAIEKYQTLVSKDVFKTCMGIQVLKTSLQVSAIIFDCETFNNFFTYVAKTLVNLKNRRIAMAPLFLRLILLKKSSQINQKSFQLEFFIIFFDHFELC